MGDGETGHINPRHINLQICRQGGREDKWMNREGWSKRLDPSVSLQGDKKFNNT
jgi:hypothetical protein